MGHGGTSGHLGEFGKDFARRCVLALAQHRIAQVAPGYGVGRLELAGPAESRLGPGWIAADHGQITERVVGAGILGVALEGPVGGGFGVFQPAQPHQHRAQPGLGVGLAGAGDGTLEKSRRGLQLALLVGQAAGQEKPFGVFRLVCAPSLQHLSGALQIATFDGQRGQWGGGLGPFRAQLQSPPSGRGRFRQPAFGRQGAGQAVVALGQFGIKPGDGCEAGRRFGRVLVLLIE